MAAPSSTVPGSAASNSGPNPTTTYADALKYAKEVVAEAATLLQEMPAEVVPIVGNVCKTFLAFKQLVEKAESNKGALSTLLQMCDIVVKDVLDARTDRPGLPKSGFTQLGEHVRKAEEVAKLCNGVRKRDRAKRFVLARKISQDIAAIREDVLAFCALNNIAVAVDTHARVLQVDKKLMIIQANDEVIQRQLALIAAKPTIERKSRGQLEVEVQRREEDQESMVKPPSGAPRIRDWHVKRKALVRQACDRLGIGSSTGASTEEPWMVGLAGPSGAGKSTVASMVIAREDVRASFHKGILWLQVGRGAKDRLSELMIRLADMVYESVMSKTCRGPRREPDLDGHPEDGATYIQEVVDESSRRFLVVADDVWEVEVLEELKRAGVWVLYTTRDDSLLPTVQPLRLDQIQKEEAKLVLRRAADLEDDTSLPKATDTLMSRSGYAVLDLAFVGRWGEVRGRNDNAAWQRALDRIVDAQTGGGDGEILSWRAAVLHAGLEELASDNPQNKDLYISLAVLPKALSFSSEVAAVLLYGIDFTDADLKAAEMIVAALERWSILTLEDGGKKRVHDEHADFMRRQFAVSQDVREDTVPRWRGYLQSVRALLAFSSYDLKQVWEDFAQVSAEEIPSRPFEAALAAMHPLSVDRPTALQTAAEYRYRQEGLWNASTQISGRLVVQEYIFGNDSETSDMEYYFYGCGSRAFEAGRFGEADNYFRQALAIQESKLETHHPDLESTLYVLLTLKKIGACACSAGRTDEAMEFYERVLEIQQKELGADHPDVSITLIELGICAFNDLRVEEAEEFYRRALAIQERKLGVHHLSLASTLMQLGACASCKAGRTEAAEEFYRRALTIRENKLGVDHLDVAATLTELGVCAYEAGRTEAAEEFYRRALTIRENKLGVDHLDVAASLWDLGICASKAGRTEAAEGFHRRELAIRESKQGVDHLDVATTLNRLGKCAYRAGSTDKAEGFHRRAMAIQESKLGVEHLDFASTLIFLGRCAFKAGRTSKAEGFHRRALAIQESKQGVDHPDVAFALNEIGLCTSKKGRTEEAEGFHRRALAIQESKLGVDHIDVAATLNELGVCACTAGRTEEAEGFHRRASAIQESKLGTDHPDMGFTLNGLGMCALKAGNIEEAEAFHRRAMAIREDKLGVDHPDVATSLNRLGLCAFESGRMEEAERFHRRALAIQESTIGVDHPDVANTLNELGECARRAGRTEEAEGFHRRAVTIRERNLRAEHPDFVSKLRSTCLVS